MFFNISSPISGLIRPILSIFRDLRGNGWKLMPLTEVQKECRRRMNIKADENPELEFDLTSKREIEVAERDAKSVLIRNFNGIFGL